MNAELKKRLKSFAWRLGGMVLVTGLGFVSANLNLIELPMSITVILGLVLGELTKMMNNAGYFDIFSR